MEKLSISALLINEYNPICISLLDEDKSIKRSCTIVPAAYWRNTTALSPRIFKFKPLAYKFIPIVHQHVIYLNVLLMLIWTWADPMHNTSHNQCVRYWYGHIPLLTESSAYCTHALRNAINHTGDYVYSSLWQTEYCPRLETCFSLWRSRCWCKKHPSKW